MIEPEEQTAQWPCAGCKEGWHAGRGNNCQGTCRKLKEWLAPPDEGKGHDKESG